MAKSMPRRLDTIVGPKKNQEDGEETSSTSSPEIESDDRTDTTDSSPGTSSPAISDAASNKQDSPVHRTSVISDNRKIIPIPIIHEASKPKSKRKVVSIPVHHEKIDQLQSSVRLRRRPMMESPPTSPASTLDVDALQNQRKSLERDMRILGESSHVLPDDEIHFIRRRMETRAADLIGVLESYKRNKAAKQKKSLLGVKSKHAMSQ